MVDNIIHKIKRDRKSRQIRRARQKECAEISLMSLAEARAWSHAHAQGEGTKISQMEQFVWSSTWLWAWPLVKTRAMVVEVETRPFGEFWGEVWTQKEAKLWAWGKKAWGEGEEAWALAWGPAWKKGLAWVEGRAKGLVGARMRGEAVAVAGALALAGVWVWARSEARARGERAPSGLADSATIRRILSSLHRHGRSITDPYLVAHRLWHHSRETRDEYSSLIHFIAPITHLPLELLRQIFLIIINEASSPPLALMLVCKHWHAIVTTLWVSLNLGTRTPMGAIRRKLERNQWLDIVVDTDSDRGDFTPSDRAFESIFAAMGASSRWRSFVVESFPVQADLSADVVNRRLQQCPNDTMSRFTTFRVKSICETSSLLDGLLRILGATARELTTVEINSGNDISFLAPSYPSIFHSIKVLSLNTPGVPNPVDLLPHLHQLETFTASHISFPIYNNDVSLLFVDTLRHLSLRAVSIQWMSGRTFHALEHCTLIFPLHHHVLHTFSATLPKCKNLTFQGYPLDILGGVSAPELSHLSVTCSGSSNGRGNRQLVQFSRHALGERRLRPRILHLNLEAGNQAWISALVFMSDLEELVIHNARPSSLGVKVFRSLIIHASNQDAPLCPSLRRFGLKYQRWLRRTERFNLIPDFVSVIRSREHSNYSLQSFRIWLSSYQKDPLELIEGSEMSSIGLERLANESRRKVHRIHNEHIGLTEGS